MLITCAAAQIALQSVTNLFIRGLRIAVEDLRASNDHSGSAVAALQTMAFPETFLNRVQLAIAG